MITVEKTTTKVDHSRGMQPLPKATMVALLNKTWGAEEKSCRHAMIEFLENSKISYPKLHNVILDMLQITIFLYINWLIPSFAHKAFG